MGFWFGVVFFVCLFVFFSPRGREERKEGNQRFCPREGYVEI
jgi:hypothetical protein